MDTNYLKGLRYELIAKAIFQEILKADGVVTLRIEHLATIQGLKTRWKIDLLWEFQHGGIQYLTVVQAKNWKRKVSQEHVGAFQAVLDDIPGQPRGVMVSSGGFQDGARRLATALGILLYELGPLPKTTTAICDYGWATMRLNLGTMSLETTVFNPDVQLTFRAPPGTNISANVIFKPKPIGEYGLFDAEGQSLGTMRDVVAELVGRMREQGELSATRSHVFNGPTFIRHEQIEQQIPLIGVTAQIAITPERRPDMPVLPAGFVVFVLRNVLNGDSSAHAIDSRPGTSK